MGNSSRVPRGRAGRKGQQHRATPTDLRSYDIPPASAVTITRADGTTEQQPALRAKAATTPSRRRGPAVCAMCGRPIKDNVRISKDAVARGKPVHEECETKAKGAARGRIARQKAEEAGRAARPLTPQQALKESVSQENKRLKIIQDGWRAKERERKEAEAEARRQAAESSGL
ncbi:hypothetical protein QMK19_40190 [Streptomyces sp. H10-C2]|uniref:hypothetical protein n=1 Tax=unclassified Streptomyces TaxID=2593676 RepID=UPI0024BB0404|nr:MULTISPECIES: hypothetical protein [unclassified Streptomyces]MDJ0347472.1 hypothetical protein [Streptomyces sp. PH10-H1]MDJ0375637.1 hypothetical protein [Streptomyces sp. H10-C2]